MTQLKTQTREVLDIYRDDNGKYHRTDGPARTWADGSYEYRVHGILHREDGPAKFIADTLWGPWEEYWLNGKCIKLKYQDKEELYT